MSPLPAALPPFAAAVPHAAHGAISTGPQAAWTVATERRWDSYIVRAGDTLYDIAEASGTTVTALVKRNELAHGGRWLMPGQQLKVPSDKSTSAARQGAQKTQPRSQSERTDGAARRASSATQVVVRPGDTLSHISAQHGVSVGAITRANGLRNPRLIYPGQRLTLPGAGAASETARSSRGVASPSRSGPSRPAKTTKTTKTTKSDTATTTKTTVTVRSGDTLSGIAARHGISLQAVLSANSGLDPRLLWVGQRVVVPGSARVPASTTPWTEDTIGDHLAGQDVENTFLHYTYSSAIARSAAANRDYLSGVPVPSRAQTKKLIADTARRHGVDPALLLALAYQESGWNQRAVSPANAIGVMQVIPSSGEWASSLVGRELNLLNPQDNVTAGTVIMRALLRSAKTEQQAIGGYYQGLASVQRNGLFSDTKHYVTSIQALRARM